MNRLLDRRDKDGAFEGWATLRGTWRHGHLDVEDQRAERPVRARQGERWIDPPCQQPPGGWPAGGELELPAAHESLELAGAIVATTIFRPVGRGPVLVVAATQPLRVADELVPLLGDRVCIISSRYTAQAVETVRRQINRSFTAWQAYLSGTTSDDGGQVLLTLELVRVVPVVVDQALIWPYGLVAVQPWLAPAT